MSFILDIFLTYFLLIMVRIENVNPDRVPHSTPLTISEDILKDGSINIIPRKVTNARKIFLITIFSLKKRGSSKAVNMGNVEKVMRPMATVEL